MPGWPQKDGFPFCQAFGFLVTAHVAPQFVGSAGRAGRKLVE